MIIGDKREQIELAKIAVKFSKKDAKESRRMARSLCLKSARFASKAARRLQYRFQILAPFGIAFDRDSRVC